MSTTPITLHRGRHYRLRADIGKRTYLAVDDIQCDVTPQDSSGWYLLCEDARARYERGELRLSGNWGADVLVVDRAGRYLNYVTAHGPCGSGWMVSDIQEDHHE